MINTRDISGQTALHRAAQRGKSTVCGILLDGGADAAIKDSGGLDASAIARLSGHLALARAIADHQAQTSARFATASVPETTPVSRLTAADIARLFTAPERAVEALIAAGRRDAIDARGDTLLHLAARRGAMLACNKLFEAGMAVDACNHEGKTAADSAEAAGHRALAQLLRGKALTPDQPENREAEAPRQFLIEDSQDFGFDFADGTPVDAVTFHAGKGFGDAAGEFIAVPGRVEVRGADDMEGSDFTFGDLDAMEITGEGFASSRALAPAAEGQSFVDVRTRGRKSRKSARLSELVPMSLSDTDCRAWIMEVQSRGWIDPDLIHDLIDLCAGGHVDDIAANATRFLEDCGFSFEEEHFDPLADLDLDDMTDGLMALCNRNPALVGGTAFTLTAKEERSLLQDIRRRTAEAEAAVANDEIARSAIISLGRRLLAGSIAAAEVTRIEFSENDPRAVETFRVHLDDLEILHDDLYAGIQADSWIVTRMTDAVRALCLLPDIIEGLVEAVAAADHGRSMPLIEAALQQRRSIHKFMQRHLPWLRLCAARECRDDEEVEDIFQTAWLGMRRALERFDADRGNRFMTYSSFWMRQSILRARLDTGALVRIPVHRFDEVSGLDAARERLESMGQIVTDAALSARSGLEMHKVRESGRIPRHPVEFDDVNSDADEPHAAFDMVLQGERERIIKDALADFTARQVAIIEGRFGFHGEEEQTLEELGQRFDVTRERIRQVEAKILNILSHHTRLGRIRRFL